MSSNTYNDYPTEHGTNDIAYRWEEGPEVVPDYFFQKRQGLATDEMKEVGMAWIITPYENTEEREKLEQKLLDFGYKKVYYKDLNKKLNHPGEGT